MDRIWTIDHGKLHEQMRKNSTMSDLIARSARRHWAASVVIIVIAGIMLGVALVVSVQLANQAARGSFEHSVEKWCYHASYYRAGWSPAEEVLTSASNFPLSLRPLFPDHSC